MDFKSTIETTQQIIVLKIVKEGTFWENFAS